MVKPRTKLGEHLSPQLKDINRPWTAFLNKGEFVTGEQSTFCTKPCHKEDAQEPFGPLSHTIASIPLEATTAPKPQVRTVPLTGLWGCAGPHGLPAWHTPAPQQVLFPVPETHPCQYGALRDFPLSNLGQQLHPKRSGLFSLWQCL